MQDIKHSITRKIIHDLAFYKKVKGIRGLAKFLDEDESKLYSWINRDKIGDIGCILVKIPEINPKWLKTGKGEMLLDKNEIQPTGLVVPKIAARISPGRRICEENNQPRSDNTETRNEKIDFNIDDMLAMTRGVLLSNTVYRSALASNVRAFHQAVLMESEMVSNANEIAKLRDENREIKEMIRALEEKLTGQKRDKIINQ